MGEIAAQLPERDQEAIAFIERGLAENKTIKQILTELHAQAPYHSWGRPGVEKQWAQVWRPALLAMGKAPPRVLRQLSIRQATLAAAPAHAAGGLPAPAPAPVHASGGARVGTAGEEPAMRTPAPGGATGGMQAVDGLRSLLRPLAEVALGETPDPFRLLQMYARAHLLLDSLAGELQAREQELRLQAEELRAFRLRMQESMAAARQRPQPRVRGALEVMHQALGEVLGRDGGPTPEDLAEVARLVRTRLGQLLKELA